MDANFTVVSKWMNANFTVVSKWICRNQWGNVLTHCSLVTPYGDIELSQYWPRKWLFAWRHQAITWTNIELSKVFCGIYLRAISQKVLINLICSLCWKITLLTHWGRVTHICVGKLTIIGSDNGLSPGRGQAIIRTHTVILGWFELRDCSP